MYSYTLSLTSVLDGGVRLKTCPDHFPSQKRFRTPVKEAGCAPRPYRTGEENLILTGIQSSDRPARSKSLNCLSSRGPRHSETQKSAVKLSSKFATSYFDSC